MNFPYDKNIPNVSNNMYHSQIELLRSAAIDEIVTIDVKTANTSCGNEMIELGAVLLDMETGSIKKRFCKIVRPDSFAESPVVLSDETTRDTDVTAAMIEQAGISPKQAVMELAAFIGGRHILFYNATVDWKRFLFPVFARMQLYVYLNVFDICVLVRGFEAKHKNEKRKWDLDSLCTHYGIRAGGQRHSDIEAERVALIFRKMIKELPATIESDEESYQPEDQESQVAPADDVVPVDDVAPAQDEHTPAPESMQCSALMMCPTSVNLWARGNVVRIYANFDSCTIFYDEKMDQWGTKNHISVDEFDEAVQCVLQYAHVSSGRELLQQLRS